MDGFSKGDKLDKVLILLYYRSMNYQTVSIKETRDNLAELIERVAIGGEVFAITKFGKTKGFVVPCLPKDYQSVKPKFVKKKPAQTPAGLLLESVKKNGFVGKGPKDLAINLDKYLYGQN
jgi:antitoxin (DNA-binding transcriptional repressor) of toxin-antitoxin stability system